MLLPYKFHGSSIKGILFFKFASSEPLKEVINKKIQCYFIIKINISFIFFFLQVQPLKHKFYWIDRLQLL